MIVNHNNANHILLFGCPGEFVASFCYLGCTITTDGGADEDVDYHDKSALMNLNLCLPIKHHPVALWKTGLMNSVVADAHSNTRSVVPKNIDAVRCWLQDKQSEGNFRKSVRIVVEFAILQGAGNCLCKVSITLRKRNMASLQLHHTETAELRQ